MKTLGRNADNDLYLEAGGLAILHDADAQCAVIEAILQTQQGELQFDPDRGIDYFGTVLQNPTYIDFWAAQVQSRIEDLDFVASVDDFTYRFDNQTSTLYWSMTVTNTDEDRLDLRDKKTVIDGSPGTDISWNDIYDKPTGVQQALDMVEAMHEEAVDTREMLTPSSTLRDTKGLLNRIIFDPNNEEYSKTRQVTFTFSGIPLGTVIDVSNIRLDILNTGSGEAYYAPFIVEIDDGLKLRADQTITMAATGNEVIFLDTDTGQDEEGHAYTTQKHTLLKGGTVTLTIKGNITRIWSADESKPIFLNSKGEPFAYLSGFSVGERVPLSAIGNGTFGNFGNLQKVVWNEGNESSITFGDYAFAGCSSLMEIAWLPKKTTSLGIGCFQNCKSLLSLKGLESTQIEQIPDDCFYGCTQLKNCGNLPERITSIGSHVFKGCTSFKNIDELPQTIESLGEECFCGCIGITAILYPPESLKTIGKRCFADCSSLESLYLSASTTEIGEGAYAGCAMLTNIMSDADAVPTLDATAFDGETPIVYVPASLLSAYQSDSVWGAMTVKKYGVYEFALEDMQAGTTLLGTTSNLISDSVWTISFGIGDKQQRFIPSVDALPSFTYKDVVANATITIKGYVRRIAAASSESYPFLATTAASAFTNLKSVTVTDSPLEMIGDYAFAQCVNLASIECGLEEERDYCIGERAFWGCSALTSTAWLKAGLGRLVKEHTTTYEQLDDGTIVPIETIVLFPAFGERCFWQSGITALEYDATDVKELPSYCFAETKISSISGLGTVVLESIGDHCFYKCSYLTDITALPYTGIATLPDYCFAECNSLTSIEGIESLVSEGMGSHVFENCAIENILPIANASEITAIAPYMFAGCSLSSLEGLTDKITELGEGCFSRNSLLKDVSAILEAPSVTEIPAKCFQASGLLALIGCWNITSIGAYAFADCTSLISTSGLGPDIANIGDYAFQNCTGLKQVSCIASNVPTISSSAFSGAPAPGIPLYVKEDMVGNFSSAATWNSFGAIASRTIKVHLQNIGGTEPGDVNIDTAAVVNTGVKVSIDPSAEHYLGVWYADYGDGTEFEHFYSSDSSVHDALAEHTYDERGNYTITLFGDIIEVWGDHTDNIVNGDYVASPPKDMDVPPFLGGLSSTASLISINSEYLKKIGDFCFFNYGQAPIPGNDNALSVSVTMDGAGTVGAYAFAKKDDAYGPMGTLGAFNAVTVGNYAFYKGGLNSSTPFSTVKTAGKAAFAKNPLLTELAGFSSLTKVTESLFEGCTGLITTSGLSAVTEIQDYGFKDCTGLTSVKDFSASFTRIGAGAFNNCPNITRIFMANVNPPYLAQDGFDGIGNEFLPKALVYVPAGRESAYQEQEYWYKFQTESEGTIQWRITSRAITFVLQNVTKALKIPANSFIVSATGNWTLDFGEGEDKRQYTAGTNEIDTYSFNSASARKEVKISGPVTSIRCTSSAYPIFGKDVGGKLLTSVSISEAMDITEIGNYLFRECKALESVNNADTIVSVGEYAFADAQKLWDITGLSNISSIERYAFSGCSSLTNLYGLNRVTTIGERAFNGCSSLKKIDGLGTGVTSIGDYAFASCPLQEVQMFAEEPPTMPTTAFSGLSSEVPLYVRTKCLTAYKESSSWGSVFGDIRSRFVEFTLTACPSNLTVKGNIGKVKSDTFWVVDWDAYDSDGVPSEDGAEEQYLPAHTYTLSGTHTLRLEGDIKGINAPKPEVVLGEHDIPTAITGNSFLTLIPDGESDPLIGDEHLLTRVFRSEYSALSEVGDAAFLNNGNLTTASLAGIISIGEAAFALDKGLTNLTLLDTVGVIDKYAFFGCEGLTSITGLNGNKSKVTIAEFAFGGISGLTYVQVGIREPSDAVITQTSFGYYEPITEAKNISVYVPLGKEGEYEGTIWGMFAISSQVIIFTLANVPSGTTILGISNTNTTGTARIESESRWSIDWDDGTQNNMEVDDTSFPSHTYLYDETDLIEKDRWTELPNGTMVRPKIEIALTGSIKTLACQSNANYPFLATELGKGIPYLVSITAPDTMESLKQIGDFVFQGCSSLESVTGFTRVETIGQYAFNGCTNLSNIGDASSGFIAVTAIGNKAFANCQSLQNLASFAHVRSIGIRAFENCISLTGTTGLGSAYASLSPTDWTDQGLSATFGAYAFEGCGFGAIDMDNYNVPPTIQSTTFPGDPADVLVFVSTVDGVLESYKKASVWVRYFNNIIAASNITLTFHDCIDSPTSQTDTNTYDPVTGQMSINGDPDETVVVGETTTTTGWAFYGEGAKLNFTGSYLLIDWGDGETTTRLNESGGNEGWTLPNHPYKSLNGTTATIKIRGDITKIYPVSSNDRDLDPARGEKPDDSLAPCIGLIPFTEVSSSKDDFHSLDYDYGKIIYDAKVSLEFGTGSKLERIGSYSFQNCNISSLTFGKPSGEPLVIGDCAFRKCHTSTLNITESVRAADSSLAPVSTRDSIKSIGNYAFEDCTQLNSTEFLDGATESIGVGAFKGCAALNSIKLPASLLSVCESAFEGCSGIVGGITWKQSTDDDILDNPNITIGARAFYGCTGANNEEWAVSIPSQVKSIGESAFENCGMKSFTWGNATDPHSYALPAGAFRNCANLVSFNAYGITSIGAYAFFGCTSLPDSSFASIIASAEGSLGNYAFALCPKLGDITIPLAITSLGEGCFSRSNRNLLYGHFYTSPDGDSQTLGERYTGITDFENWMSAKYGEKHFDVWAKYDKMLRISDPNYSALRIRWGEEGSGNTWTAPDNASIGAACFMNCRGLVIEWDKFPSLTLIPAYCFYNCNSLFSGRDLSELPDTIEVFERFALARTGISSIGRTGNSLSATFAPALFLGCENLTSLNGIQTLFSSTPSALNEGCFHGCTNLKEVNALSATTPVVQLGAYCFAYCTKLKGSGSTLYNISNALQNIIEIGEGCFEGCTGITKFDGLAKVTYYPYRAFYGCGITRINRLCSAEVGATNPVTLVGDSFGGNKDIRIMYFPYGTDENPKVVQVEEETGYVEDENGENGEDVLCYDPFSAIDTAEKKRTVQVAIPTDMIPYYQTYQPYGPLGIYYWAQYALVTDTSSSNLAMSMTLQVPAGGGRIWGNGVIKKDAGKNVYIDWGDGSGLESIDNDPTDPTKALVSNLSHVYSAEKFVTSQVVPVSIFGDVISFAGEADHAQTATLGRKRVKPLLATYVLPKESSSDEDKEGNAWAISVSFDGAFLEELTDGCLGYCTNLTTIQTLPDTVTKFGDNLFFGCEKITNLDFVPLTISELGKFCFAYCKGLTDFSNLKLCTSITEIPDGCFLNVRPADSDAKLDWLPQTVNKIGFSAFQRFCFTGFDFGTSSGTPNKREITVDNYAFRYNYSLSSLANIVLKFNAGRGTNCFRECTSLANLTGLEFESSIKALPKAMFRGCTSLASFAGIPLQITEYGDGAFYGTGITSLNGINSTVTKLGTEGTKTTDSNFSTYGGVFENCASLTSLVGMPTSVSYLGAAAFRGCEALTGLSGIPKNSSISAMGDSCFAGCTSIEDLSGIENTGIKDLPQKCFAGCTALQSIVYDSANEASRIRLPAKIEMIGKNCFEGCKKIRVIMLDRWMESAAEPVTYLADTNQDPNVFEYAALRGTVKIRVPDGALAEYQSQWAGVGSNRFDDDDIEIY